MPTTLGEAALGARIDIPTPKGTVSLQVPPGTSSGTKLRVKGHGIPAKTGAAGDLLAEIQIVLPKPLDEASQQAIRQIEQRLQAESPQQPPLVRRRKRRQAPCTLYEVDASTLHPGASPRFRTASQTGHGDGRPAISSRVPYPPRRRFSAGVPLALLPEMSGW